MFKRLLVTFAPLLALMLVIGGLYVHFESQRSDQLAYSDLRSVAKLKTDQITAWLQERQGDADTLQGSLNLALRIQHFLANGQNTVDRDILNGRFATLRQAYGYSSVLLLDTAGNRLTGVGEHQDVTDTMRALMVASLQDKQIRHSDLHREASGHIHMDWLIPMRDRDAPDAHILAFLVLRASPEKSLYPKILPWPTSSQTSETLIIRREERAVRYLTPVRGQTDGPFQLSVPLDTPELADAIAAVATAPGTTAGRNTLGVFVLAAYHPIPDTQWVLVTQVSRAEVRAPLWRTLNSLLIISLIALLVVMRLFWRQMVQQSRLQQLEIESEKHRANAQLQALGDNLANGLIYQFEMLPDGTRRFNYISAGVATLFGVPPEAVLADASLMFRDIDPAGRDDYFREEARSAQALTPFSLVMAFNRPNRDTLWLAVSSCPHQSTEGGIIWDGLALDVTEAKVAEAQLAQSENRFRSLFEDTAQALTLVENGVFVAVNRASLAMLGLTAPEQLLGRTPMDISPAIQPDGRASAEKVQEVIATAFAQGSHFFEWQHLRADGTSFIAEVLVTALTVDQSPKLHVVWRDITAEKAAEEELDRYRTRLEQEVEARTAELQATTNALRVASEEQIALFETASVGIVYVRGRQILRCNPALEQLFGYAPGEMIGQTTASWYADAATFAEIGQTIATALREQGLYREDRALCRKDGSRFWGRMTAQLVDRSDPGRGLVGIVEDITKERQAFEDMARARALAEDAARMKFDFVANMSHEIRTPMNAIIGLTHLALGTELTPKQRDYLTKVQTSSQHLLGIINDILDFSKIEAGKLNIEQIEFTLEKVLEQVTGLIADKVHAKGLELIIDVAPNVPMRLLGDPLRIGQILINYANNALKFTEHGEISLGVSLEKTLGEDLFLRFAVTDTGIGISDEQLGRLFKSFEQADTSTTRKYGGTGLGLAISKRLAELMGGEVGLSSEVGRGSTFWFTARVGIADPNQQPLQPEPDLRHRRMLVVDDNAHACQVLGEMLRSMTFETTTAMNGADALQAITQAAAAGRPFEIIFIDWQMPTMDGITLAGKIAALPLQPPPHRVIFTAYGRDELMVSARAAGIEHVLIKPVTPSILFDTAMQLLGGPVLQQRAHAPVGQPLDHSEFSGLHALLVEDNDLNQQVARELLQAIGFTVEVADNGAIALEKLAASAFDVVLMDMQMPVMDGITATHEIRRRPEWQALPIVAMTANAMAADRDRCLAAGMNDHLAKPIDPTALRQTLRQWVQGTAATAGPPSSRPIHPAAPDTPRLALDLPAPLSTLTGLDATTGLRLAMGRADLYLALLHKFVASQREFTVRLRSTVAEGQFSEAHRMAHTLKGISSQIGARALHELAMDLETALAGTAPAPDLEDRIRKTETALRALIDEVTPHLPTNASPAPPALDADAFARCCDRLESLLRTADFSSLELLESEATQFRAGLGEAYSLLRTAVDDFDYLTALEILRAARPTETNAS